MMGGKRQFEFGWRVNQGADGFEQTHGRFTMEVFWHEPKRSWGWVVWSTLMIDGTKRQAKIAEGVENTLINAKKTVLRSASALERESLLEDQKFR
jgi:hypothetical protein